MGEFGVGEERSHFAMICVWGGGGGREVVLQGLVKKNLQNNGALPAAPICHPTFHPASSSPFSHEKITKHLQLDLENFANDGSKNYSNRTHISKDQRYARTVLMLWGYHKRIHFPHLCFMLRFLSKKPLRLNGFYLICDVSNYFFT